MGQEAEQAGQLRSCVTFYKEVLETDEYIIQILEENYTISMSSWPTVVGQNDRVGSCGILYCERTEVKPYCCNPMTDCSR